MTNIVCLNPEFSTTRLLTSDVPNLKSVKGINTPSSATPFKQSTGMSAGGLRESGYYKPGHFALPTCKENGNDLLITAIIVVFNGSDTLERTINSIIRQTSSNLELIIIDGGSVDGTLDIIRKYQHAIDFWCSEPDAGIYDAMNKGINYAGGEWICFIGADDYFRTLDVVERVSSQIARLPAAINLTYGRVSLVNSEGKDILDIGEPWFDAKAKLSYTMSIPHQGLFHKRCWFENYGLFDTSFKIVADYEMLLRGWPSEELFYLDDIVVTAMGRQGVSSMPQNSLLILKEVGRARKKHNINISRGRLFLAWCRVYVRIVLNAALGRNVASTLLDFGRRLSGIAPYWKKL